MIYEPDFHSVVAANHAAWCAEQNMTPEQTMSSVGVKWTGKRLARWDDAVLALTAAHRKLVGR